MANLKFKNLRLFDAVDTFGSLLEKTNQIIKSLYTEVVTAKQTPEGGITSGNVVITSNTFNSDSNVWSTSVGGYVQANTVIAVDGIKGSNGSLGNTSTLNVLSEVNFTQNVMSLGTLSTDKIISAGVWDHRANVNIRQGDIGTISLDTLNLSGGDLGVNYSGNTEITSNNFAVKSNNTITALSITNNGSRTATLLDGQAFIVDTDTMEISSNVEIGDSAANHINVAGRIISDIIPNNNNHSLGSDSGRWDLYGEDIDAVDLDISENTSLSGNSLFSNTTAIIANRDITFKANTTANTIVASELTSNNTVLKGGSVTINASTVSITAGITDTIKPSTSNTSLGTTTYRWNISATGIEANNQVKIIHETDVTTGVGNQGALRVSGGSYFGKKIFVDGQALFNGGIKIKADGLIDNRNRPFQIYDADGDLLWPLT